MKRRFLQAWLEYLTKKKSYEISLTLFRQQIEIRQKIFVITLLRKNVDRVWEKRDRSISLINEREKRTAARLFYVWRDQFVPWHQQNRQDKDSRIVRYQSCLNQSTKRRVLLTWNQLLQDEKEERIQMDRARLFWEKKVRHRVFIRLLANSMGFQMERAKEAQAVQTHRRVVLTWCFLWMRKWARARQHKGLMRNKADSHFQRVTQLKVLKEWKRRRAEKVLRKREKADAMGLYLLDERKFGLGQWLAGAAALSQEQAIEADQASQFEMQRRMHISLKFARKWRRIVELNRLQRMKAFGQIAGFQNEQTKPEKRQRRHTRSSIEHDSLIPGAGLPTQPNSEFWRINRREEKARKSRGEGQALLARSGLVQKAQRLQLRMTARNTQTRRSPSSPARRSRSRSRSLSSGLHKSRSRSRPSNSKSRSRSRSRSSHRIEAQSPSLNRTMSSPKREDITQHSSHRRGRTHSDRLRSKQLLSRHLTEAEAQQPRPSRTDHHTRQSAYSASRSIDNLLSSSPERALARPFSPTKKKKRSPDVRKLREASVLSSLELSTPHSQQLHQSPPIHTPSSPTLLTKQEFSEMKERRQMLNESLSPHTLSRVNQPLRSSFKSPNKSPHTKQRISFADDSSPSPKLSQTASFRKEPSSILTDLSVHHTRPHNFGHSSQLIATSLLPTP
ncbi:hypothetical protein BLNAU_15777 [Blattamonas nauphoetae]|uniref:Sfi1 spindle body domain-containing protein n=1 Tax=Blattamonas nauphoetae TaxID=2049346 RepID=A0ABQ9X9S6_9EUKA|nr:hypothetical protein BLNAU_15777 [Blattamonas nauphoetae]